MFRNKNIILLCAVICLSNSIVNATDICLSSTPCKCVSSAGIVDLSSVGKKDHPKYYEIRSIVLDDTSLYSYNPCHEFDSTDPYAINAPGNKPCKNAAACVRTPGGRTGEPPEEHAIGLQSEARFGTIERYGFHVNYSVPHAKQMLTVILNCVNDTVENSTLVVNGTDALEEDRIIMILNSTCACPNGCVTKDPSTTSEGGLSTGSKLLIAFFTILLAYFLIGTIWNFCNGAQGLELVPNFEFWNELPKLIIEGLAFTCSCFGKKSSYGEV